MHTNFRGSQEWRNENLSLTTGSNEACKLYDAFLTQYIGFFEDESLGGIRGTVDKLKKTDENFVMGLVVENALSLLGGGRPIQLDKALRDNLARMKELEQKTPNLTWRERKHVAALDLWSQGFIQKAGQVWEDILLEFPTDLLAANFAFMSYFFQGQSFEMRDCFSRILPYWKSTMPHYCHVLAMHSFGMQETNFYPEAEAFARKALSLNPCCAWATHALCHVMEMQGRQEEGIHMMDSTVHNWESCDLMASHHHWHWALYHVELGDYESALTALDKEISSRAYESGGMLALTDVCSLLFRLQMEGVNVGDRWAKLYDAIKDHLHDHIYMINDVHILIACLGANRKEAAQELMDSIEKFIRAGQGTTRDVAARVGEPLMKAFMAYNEGDFASTVDLMLPVRHDVISIGGSHAHRDLFSLFLIQAAIKSPVKKHHKLARSFLNERKALKPNAPMTDRLIAKVLEAHGD